MARAVRGSRTAWEVDHQPWELRKVEQVEFDRDEKERLWEATVPRKCVHTSSWGGG
jgi:hypothetical protein